MGSFLIIDKLRKILEITNENESTLADLKILISEIIEKYDELYRLYRWREKILKNGDELEKHSEEFKKIEKLLIKEGFYLLDDNIDKEIRFLFNQIR